MGGGDHAGHAEVPCGEVTAIRVRKGRSDRVVVEFEGSSRVELADVVVQQAGVHTGTVLSDEDVARLHEEDEPHRARSRALKILATKDRSVEEMRSRLQRAGFSEEVASGTVAWLEGIGYLDDRRFAEAFISQRLAGGVGERRVRSDLARLGVDRHLADELLEAASADHEAADAREEALLHTVRRRFGRQFATDPRAAQRRLAGFLVRRGYGWDLVERLASALKEEAAGEGDESTDPPADSPG